MIKHTKIYYYTQIIYYIIFGFSLIGIQIISPIYLPIISNLIKLYISIILIWKFNPYMYKSSFVKSHDRYLIFSSAIYLLITTIIGDVFS